MNPLRRRIQTAMQSGGGAAAWTPTDIAGLQLWLDASQITGLNDGDSVATWPDASGNGHDATQATASKQPTYQTNEVNGKPAVQTDGVDDFIRSTFATAQPFTRFSVWSVSLPSFNHILGGVAANVALWCPSPNAMQLYAGTFGPVASVSSSTWVLVVECYDGASSFIEVGGARTTGNPSTGSPGGVTIGADNGGNANTSGKYAEVLHYAGRLSDGDISTLVTYLNTKYGL